jgi:predicted house-cleaning noncanonical NTP pyrophosphatase (MazG superfamily)
MPRFRFNKLVRDKILEKQKSTGIAVKYHSLKDEHHKKQLINKIIEESKEVIEALPEDVAGEIADVQQAVDDLIWKYGLTKQQIKVEQTKKRKQNGSFKKGIYIHYTDVPDNHEWLSYYRTKYKQD